MDGQRKIRYGIHFSIVEAETRATTDEPKAGKVEVIHGSHEEDENKESDEKGADQSESLADISRISKPMQDSTTDIIEGLVEKAVSEVDPSYSESNIQQ